MEVYKDGMYWYVKSSHGPVPKKLQGMWTTKEAVDKAIEMFQAGVRSRALNVTQRSRARKERHETDDSTTTA